MLFSFFWSHLIGRQATPAGSWASFYLESSKFTQSTRDKIWEPKALKRVVLQKAGVRSLRPES